MPRGRGRSPFSGVRRGRGYCYTLARLIGDVLPWLELDLKAILRRIASKWLLRSALGSGGGPWWSWVKGGAVLGLRSLLGFGSRRS